MRLKGGCLSVQPEPGTPQNPPPAGGRYRLGVVVAIGFVGLVSGWILGSTTGSGSSPRSEPDPVVSGPTSTADVTTTTTQSTTTSEADATATTDFPPLRGRVEPLVGAAELAGPVAMAAIAGQIESENLWVLQSGGRLVQRVDVPLRPGGFEHQILIVGDYILFSTTGGTYKLGVDLSEPAEQIAGESFLIPGSTPEVAWIIGGFDLQWFAPFNGHTGEIGSQTDIDQDFGWPFAGYDGGVLFHPNDADTYGEVAYWPTGGQPEPFGLAVGSDATIHQITGHLAVLLFPGPVVKLIGVETLEEVLSYAVPSEGQPHVVNVCLSPDAQQMAVMSSSGPLEVIQIPTGKTVAHIQDEEIVSIVGWAAPNQFLYVTESQGRTQMISLDIKTGSTARVARLAALGNWRIATSGQGC